MNTVKTERNGKTKGQGETNAKWMLVNKIVAANQILFRYALLKN